MAPIVEYKYGGRYIEELVKKSHSYVSFYIFFILKPKNNLKFNNYWLIGRNFIKQN